MSPPLLLQEDGDVEGAEEEEGVEEGEEEGEERIPMWTGRSAILLVTASDHQLDQNVEGEVVKVRLHRNQNKREQEGHHHHHQQLEENAVQ